MMLQQALGLPRPKLRDASKEIKKGHQRLPRL
jgi:hypothetical protein